MTSIACNSFTRTSNSIIDEWGSKLKSSPFKTLIAITRKMIGFDKDRDYLSNSQLQELTGLSEATVRRALKVLASMGIIKIYRVFLESGVESSPLIVLNLEKLGYEKKLTPYPIKSKDTKNRHSVRREATDVAEGKIAVDADDFKQRKALIDQVNDILEEEDLHLIEKRRVERLILVTDSETMREALSENFDYMVCKARSPFAVLKNAVNQLLQLKKIRQ